MSMCKHDRSILFGCDDATRTDTPTKAPIPLAQFVHPSIRSHARSGQPFIRLFTTHAGTV